MKAIVWFISIFGILPALYLSALNLYGHIRLQTFFKGEDSPHFVWVSIKPTLSFWPFKYQELTLTHSLFPAILTIIGICIMLVGLFFLIPKQPTIIYTNGMDEIPNYVSKLLSSKSRSASIGIFSVDGRKGFGIYRKEGLIEISLSSVISPPDGIEPMIRSLYNEIGIQLSEEYTFNSGDCISLKYVLPSDPQAIRKISERTLKEVFGIKEDAPLKFTFKEHECHNP